MYKKDDEEDLHPYDAAPEEIPEGREEAEETRQTLKEIMLMRPNGEMVEVLPEDLDSDFDIGFSDAGRSPTADAELRQNIIGLMDQLLQLHDISQKGGHMGVIATELFKTLHEKFELPPTCTPII